MNEQIIAYKDELLLLSWSDTSRNGQTVTFRVAPGFEVHPFRESPTGKKTGKRYAAVLVEINDDETPVVQTPKGGPLSKEAAGLCKREDFRRYLSCGAPRTMTEEEAAEFLRIRCGVVSRAALDHAESAKQKFYKLKSNFLSWQFDNEVAV